MRQGQEHGLVATSGRLHREWGPRRQLGVVLHRRQVREVVPTKHALGYAKAVPQTRIIEKAKTEPRMAKSREAGRSRRARYGRFSANWLLCLLGLVLVTGNPLALAQDVLEAPEEVDTSSLIIADIRKPVYVDEEGNFVEADTDKYSETFVPACSQVCA